MRQMFVQRVKEKEAELKEAEKEVPTMLHVLVTRQTLTKRRANIENIEIRQRCIIKLSNQITCLVEIHCRINKRFENGSSDMAD